MINKSIAEGGDFSDEDIEETFALASMRGKNRRKSLMRAFAHGPSRTISIHRTYIADKA